MLSPESRCVNCGETKDYTSADIDVGARRSYEMLHNISVCFDNGSFQSVISTVEANMGLLDIPYAKFLYGLSIWRLERIQNVERAAPILIEAIRSANTYSSANYMSSYACELLSNYAVQRWRESRSIVVDSIKEYYSSQADYEVASANGGTIAKMNAKSMLNFSKSAMNKVVSKAVKNPLTILKVAYLISGNYEMLRLGTGIVNDALAMDVDISLDLTVTPLVNFFKKSAKDINKTNVVKEFANSKLIPASPIVINKFSVRERESDEQKYVSIDFEAPSGIDAVEFSILPFDAAGKELYRDDDKYIYRTARPVAAGKNTVTFSLPCANRTMSVAICEDYIQYMTGESEVFIDLDLIDAPVLTELDGRTLEAHERLLGKGVRYLWQEEGDIWICPCGKTNSRVKENCPICGRNLSELREKASDERVKEEIETIRRETARAHLREYRCYGIELCTQGAVFKYDPTECVLKKDGVAFNRDTAVWLTDLGASVLYINADDGSIYSVDMKSFASRKIFFEKATAVYLFGDKLYVATESVVYILNTSTFAEEGRLKAQVKQMCAVGNAVYYLESNGHVGRIDASGKHDKLVSHVSTMTVVENKIIFSGKKGLTIADLNNEKQKVGFLTRSFLTNEQCINGIIPTLLSAHDGVVYYSDRIAHGVLDIADRKVIAAESVPLVCIYDTGRDIVGVTDAMEQISLKK